MAQSIKHLSGEGIKADDIIHKHPANRKPSEFSSATDAPPPCLWMTMRNKIIVAIVVFLGIPLIANSGPWTPHPMFTAACQKGMRIWRTVPAICDGVDNYFFYDTHINLAVVVDASDCPGTMSSWPSGTPSDCVLFEGSDCEIRLEMRRDQLIMISSDKNMKVYPLAHGTVESWAASEDIMSCARDRDSRNLWNLFEDLAKQKH